MSFVQLFHNPRSLRAAYKVLAAQSPRYASPNAVMAQEMLTQTRKAEILRSQLSWGVPEAGRLRL